MKLCEPQIILFAQPPLKYLDENHFVNASPHALGAAIKIFMDFYLPDIVFTLNKRGALFKRNINTFTFAFWQIWAYANHFCALWVSREFIVIFYAVFRVC